MNSSLPEDVSRDLERVASAVGRQEFDPLTTILTSRDELVLKMRDDLAVDDLAEGFERVLLPLSPGSGSASIYVGAANSTTQKHSHESNTLHLIATGCVRVNGQILSSGDWVYVPPDMEYELEVGWCPCIVFYWHWIELTERPRRSGVN